MALSMPILLVEDDDSLRGVVELALRAEGYEVLSAPHGAAALDLADSRRPGLILLDMHMPVMDGWQFARTYRQTPGPHVPIIVFTAAEVASERARQIDADDVLSKPFELSELFSTVKRHLSDSEGPYLDRGEAERIIARAQTAEAYYHGVFSSVADAILVTDERSRIIDVNTAATGLLGYRRAELLQLRLTDLLNVGARDPGASAIANAPTWRREVEARRKDGASVAVEVRSTELHLPSGVVHVAVLRDISERKRAEAAAAAAAAAEEADRLKTDLLNTVSHELRTPLAAIKGFTSMLLTFSGSISADEQMGVLTEIDMASDRLLELVNNLLDLSRLESGTLRMDVGPINPSEATADAVREMRRRYPERELTLAVAPSVPHVVADPRRLTQVVTNLIDNAVRFSPDGGPIEVRVGTDEAGTVIEVTDHGVGIAPQHLDRIFERFYRVQDDHTRQIAGTGLGLAISRRIVEQLKGDITVRSAVGEGSTFTVTLPRAST